MNTPALVVGDALTGLPSSLIAGMGGSYLSDLPLRVVENGHGDIALDRANVLWSGNDDGALSVGREMYAKGVGVFAPSDLRVDLTTADYTRFQSTVGLQRYMDGPVQFEVLADGELLYQSPVLGREETDTIDVDVSGYEELQLRVVSAGGSLAYQASWVDAQLLKHTDQSPIATETTITDALGYRQTLAFDGEGRVVQRQGNEDMYGSRDTSYYVYDAAGNLTRMIQQDSIAYTENNYRYDARGNIVHEQDREGHVITRTYSSSNQILSETRYLTPDVDGITNDGVASDPQTRHYVYDAEDHLRFTVSAEGDVQEYRYNAEGDAVSHIVYTAAAYEDSDMGLGTLEAWSRLQDLTAIQRTDTAYDFRGQVARVTQFAQTDALGVGIADGSESETRYVYDQNGRVLAMISPEGVASNDSDGHTTTFVYDGLGRLLSTTDAQGYVSSTIYNDAQQQIQTVAANGLVSTSVLDSNGRIVSVSESTQAGGVLDTTQYDYDARGQLIATTDALGQTHHRLIDGDGRLIGTIDPQRHLVQYVYDHQGNVTQTIGYAAPLSGYRAEVLMAAARRAIPSPLSIR